MSFEIGLIVGPEETARIAAVIAHAEANAFDIDAMRHTEELWQQHGIACPVGDDERHVALLPPGVCCVFSIEQQPEPTGWARHLSLSVKCPDCSGWHLPTVAIAGEVLRLFGFRGGCAAAFAYREDKAVNFIESLNQPTNDTNDTTTNA